MPITSTTLPTAAENAPAMPQAAHLIRLVSDTYRLLQHETDLSPLNTVATAAVEHFTSAVQAAARTASEHDITAVLSSRSVQWIRPKLLEKLSAAEYETEQFFASRFLASPDFSMEKLADFWDIAQYHALILSETNMIRAACPVSTDNTKDVVFVGSGPLPLSAIFYQAQLGKPIVCLDSNPQAVQQGRAIAQRLGVDIVFTHTSGQEYDYRNAELVIVASLVPEKEAVIRRVLHTTDVRPYMAFRTATGLNTLLYEPIRHTTLRTHGLTVIGETQPSPERINSTVLCKA